ncbi:DUF547 domain-containing protein [Sabulilitoribacter arenilitoris]|uniref:DUF547 domain-containing protein n=1 Tax=Wocania arenilitoris TaxID=2044858 RepID=A0AAE3JNY0_9FLAO|nr:DUF547 domain-containing protein [Wocania arenilitoris]MCF7567685.1 DUF547 domain-containing protein [Wocania arenilitoris]
MKYLVLILLLSFLTSCSGTKKITKNTSKPKAVEETTTVKKVDTLVKKEPKTKEDSQNLEITEEEVNKYFNQTLSKRFITTHQLWDELLVKHVSNNGVVNYKSFKTNRKKLLDYIHTLNLMFSNEAFQTLSKQDKLAFWINAYNAMTVDLILRHYPIKSIKEIDKPWDLRYWKLGNKWYNLNEIEHKILRKMNEPRIHFAIVCASVSCPKLLSEAFTASNLEEQLTKTTKDFLSDSTKNNISKDNIKLSKIFQWFAKDFKQDGSLIDFLNQYSEIKISAKAKKNFKNYNWSLNE